MKNNLTAVLKKFYPVFAVILAGVAFSFVSRLVLFVYSFPNLTLTIPSVLGIFLIGLFYDLCFLSYAIIPLLLFVWLANDTMYEKPGKYITLALLSILIAWAFVDNPLPKEYDAKLPWVYVGLLFLLLGIFIFLNTKNKTFRHQWRVAVLYGFVFFYLFLFIFNVVSEFTFWEEFGSRYNFIAVDYLVYTNEVVGNIWQSYPVGWILAALLVVTILSFLPFRKGIRASVDVSVPFLKRTLVVVAMLSITALVYFFVTNQYKKISDNDYVNELAGNGVYEFGSAFLNNDLDFYKFYQTIPDSEALQIVRSQILQRSPSDSFLNNNTIERLVKYDGEEKRLNVVLISIESFSASFMNKFGNPNNITPHLDSLINHSIFFSNFYATGTRTVRGLEALSLSIPPIPGQSIVRRPNNDNLFSIGAVLRSKGYTTQFLYGGYSTFDNMGPYFSANGYEVLDRSVLHKDSIHYANIWGVADEDMFTYALTKFDENTKNNQPFFAHIMTVSNHRPYTYPENRIDIPPSEQKRDGAVKYTDYCINRFLNEASQKSWFKNTIFVIVADHCASASGKQALPVTGYHIPLFIYSPSNIAPKEISTLSSQMDVCPTILGLLNMTYKSKFFGQDMLRMPTGTERIFLSTYSGLGFLKNSNLIVQMPPKKIEALLPDFKTGEATKIAINDSLKKQAIAHYQLAEKLFKSNAYKAY